MATKKKQPGNGPNMRKPAAKPTKAPVKKKPNMRPE